MSFISMVTRILKHLPSNILEYSMLIRVQLHQMKCISSSIETTIRLFFVRTLHQVLQDVLLSIFLMKNFQFVFATREIHLLLQSSIKVSLLKSLSLEASWLTMIVLLLMQRQSLVWSTALRQQVLLISRLRLVRLITSRVLSKMRVLMIRQRIRYVIIFRSRTSLVFQNISQN